jgi:hypothetical protein
MFEGSERPKVDTYEDFWSKKFSIINLLQILVYMEDPDPNWIRFQLVQQAGFVSVINE